MLSNAYFLAKIRFDTAENEPAKKIRKFIFCKKLKIFKNTNFANFGGRRPREGPPAEVAQRLAREPPAHVGVRPDRVPAR